jgi:hypothetical protein
MEEKESTLALMNGDMIPNLRQVVSIDLKA